MENSPSMPWCSDSDTLPSSLSNCVTALFSFPLHPTAFDVSSFFDTKQHVTREVRCRLLASKAGKKTRRRGRGRVGGGKGVGGENGKKRKTRKKKEENTKKKSIVRIMIIKTIRPFVQTCTGRLSSRGGKGGEGKGEGEGNRESSIETR